MCACVPHQQFKKGNNDTMEKALIGVLFQFIC